MKVGKKWEQRTDGENGNMVDLNPTILILLLNVNGLKTSMERYCIIGIKCKAKVNAAYKKQI